MTIEKVEVTNKGMKIIVEYNDETGTVKNAYFKGMDMIPCEFSDEMTEEFEEAVREEMEASDREADDHIRHISAMKNSGRYV